MKFGSVTSLSSVDYSHTVTEVNQNAVLCSYLLRCLSL